MRKRKIPLRKCVACDERRPKQELLRIVRNKEGYVDVDLVGKMNGRGAYICPTRKCLDKVEKNKQLSRALKIDIPDELYDKIRSIIEDD
ncbi:MAG TPA: YlxR family protein [Tepidimicrobium sp.]|nr:YlxR family protein [Tepidimicrobium sp.]